MPQITIETQEVLYKECMEQFGKIGIELPSDSPEASRFYQLQTKFMRLVDNYRLLLQKPTTKDGLI